MRTVNLFVTCLVDTFYPQTGQALVSVFNRLGLQVHLPQPQTCCGQPAFNAGLWEDARPLAQQLIQTFERVAGDIVAPSGSCVHMLRHGYLQLFPADDPWHSRAAALGQRVYEFSEYLVDVLGVVDVGACWPGRLTYHPSCHLVRGLGIERQPLVLLQKVHGLELVTLPQAAECCGFGGVFAAEMPELSHEMLLRKLGNVARTTAEAVVVADSGCRLHMDGGLRRQQRKQRVVHLAEVLARQADC